RRHQPARTVTATPMHRGANRCSPELAPERVSPPPTGPVGGLLRKARPVRSRRGGGAFLRGRRRHVHHDTDPAFQAPSRHPASPPVGPTPPPASGSGVKGCNPLGREPFVTLPRRTTRSPRNPAFTATSPSSFTAIGSSGSNRNGHRRRGLVLIGVLVLR